MILVTGATGQVGRETTRALVAHGAPARVLVRDPADVEGLKGVEVVAGVFEDEPALAHAMRGVGVLMLIGRDNPDQLAQHENVLGAAERADVGHVVKLSAIGASSGSPIELMRDHAAVEHRMRSRLPRWTVARPHLYMQNILRSAEAVRTTGRLSAPLGDARLPLVDARDVGAALAAILVSASRHVEATYTLTGPAAVGYDDVAVALSRVIERPVSYEAVTPDTYEQELLAAGLPDWRARDIANIASAYGDGDLAPTTDLETLLGRAPRSLDEFLEDHREAFAGADAPDA